MHNKHYYDMQIRYMGPTDCVEYSRAGLIMKNIIHLINPIYIKCPESYYLGPIQ